MRRGTVVSIVAVAIIAVLAGMAAATHNSTGVFSACYAQRNGAVKLIGEPGLPTTCGAGNVAFSFNEQGTGGLAGYEVVRNIEQRVASEGQTTFGLILSSCAGHDNKKTLSAGGSLSHVGPPNESPNPAPGWYLAVSMPFETEDATTLGWLLMWTRDANNAPADSFWLRTAETCATAS